MALELTEHSELELRTWLARDYMHEADCQAVANVTDMHRVNGRVVAQVSCPCGGANSPARIEATDPQTYRAFRLHGMPALKCRRPGRHLNTVLIFPPDTLRGPIEWVRHEACDRLLLQASPPAGWAAPRAWEYYRVDSAARFLAVLGECYHRSPSHD